MGSAFRLVLESFEGGPVVQSDGFTFFEAKSEKERERVYRLRFRIYAAAGHIDPIAHPDGLLQDEYDDLAIQLLAVDRARREVGTLRIVLDSAAGFPIERVLAFEAPPIPRKQLVEISRFSIVPECRGGSHEVVLGFAQLLYESIRDRRITHWLCFMPVAFRDSLEVIGYPHQELAMRPLSTAHERAREPLRGYFERQDVRAYLMDVVANLRRFTMAKRSGRGRKPASLSQPRHPALSPG